MDANKEEKLKEIGYQVKPCCFLCKHSKFPNKESGWGTCTKYSYDHIKHSDTERELSINKNGICRDGFEEDNIFPTEFHLGKFNQFFQTEG